MVKVRLAIISTILSLFISISLFIFNFFFIYLVIDNYGTEFSGFTRLNTAMLSFIGSSDDGLGIVTVLFLIKPLFNKDYYRINDILLTAKKKYRKKFFTTIILILLILIFFLGYYGIFQKNKITVTQYGDLSIIEIIVIVLSIASKNLFSLLWVAPYENLLRADQSNYVNRLVYLITDLLFYSLLFFLINKNYNPVYVFLIFFLYSFVKSILLRIYVKIKYPWINFKNSEIENKLILKTKGIDLYKISTLLLYNSIIIGTALLIGFSAVTFISLYLIVIIAFRNITNSLIYSFKEYFVTISNTEGRVYWSDFQKFERYTIGSAAISFIIQFLFAPYIVNALFDGLIQNLDITSNYYLYKDIFTTHTFAMIMSIQTFIFLLSQPHNIMIFSKKIFSRVAISSFWISIVSVILSFVIGEFVKLISNDNEINTLYWFTSFLCVTMFIHYIYLYYYSWSKLTYNSNFKDTLVNFILILLPIVYAILFEKLYLFENSKWALSLINLNEQIYWQNWEHLSNLFLICTVFAISTVAFTMLIILPKWFIQLLKDSWIGKLFTRKKRKLSESKKPDIFLHNIDGVYYKINTELNETEENKTLDQVYVIKGQTKLEKRKVKF